MAVTVEALADELRAGRWVDAPNWVVMAAVDRIGAQIGKRTGVEEARKACVALVAQRQFQATSLLSSAWQERGGVDDPTIARCGVQARIEEGRLDEAEALIEESLPSYGRSPKEADELLGLRARIAKQRFVGDGENASLVAATDLYLEQYRNNPARFWQGINAIALMAQEAVRWLEPRPGDSAAMRATQLMAELRPRIEQGQLDFWAYATMSEAALAAGDCDQAELWLYRFVNHPRITPFALASYSRQLREIWGGMNGRHCAARLLDILTASTRELVFTTRQIASLREQAGKESGDGLERNFLRDSGFSPDVVRRMLACCQSIGCVSRNGVRLGTGFLVDLASLRDGGDDLVFVTNAHVISNDVEGAIRTDEARVSFEMDADPDSGSYQVDEVVFTSGPAELGSCREDLSDLDVTIVRLQKLPTGVPGLPLARDLPMIGPRSKAYVAGHPKGAGLQVSLHDSALLDIDAANRLVHYRTPTEPGSSGSPVFDENWQVLGVHHGGSRETPRLSGRGHYEANEGILFQAIRTVLGRP